MRITSMATLLAALLVAPNGYANADQPCISKAKQALPHVAGLVVKNSRTRPVSAAILATWKGQTRPIIVEVDIIAAGEEETYSYICVITQGSAFVRRTMN